LERYFAAEDRGEVFLRKLEKRIIFAENTFDYGADINEKETKGGFKRKQT
jgi:hypothetical protein